MEMKETKNPAGRTKFIFVTGGVLSSLGKGLTAASTGALLECRGLKVTLQKLDPYINVDPGTMNPFQHGEVFVLDDGAETDLDLGHYERYTSARLGRRNNLTTGQIPVGDRGHRASAMPGLRSLVLERPVERAEPPARFPIPLRPVATRHY